MLFRSFVRRGTTIDRPYTGGLATATNQAKVWLDKHSVEVDRITCTIIVPASRVGLLVAGQSIDVKFSHLTNYTAFTTMHCVRLTVTPVDDLARFYSMTMELLAPMPPCVPENVALLATITSTGVYCVFTNPEHAGDDDLHTKADSGVGVFVGPGTISRALTADFGSEKPFSVFVIYLSGSEIGATDPALAFEWSLDGDTWAPLTVLSSDWEWPGDEFDGSPDTIVVEPTTARYLRSVMWERTFGGGPHGYGQFYVHGWEVWACPGAVDTEIILPPPPGAPITSTSNPTVNDDVGDSYFPGQVWINTATGESFILVDNTLGAAVWASTTVATLALDDLTDVNAPAPAANDVLTWDGAEWIAAPGGGGADTDLVSVADAGSSEQIDVAAARTYDLTLTENCTLTLTGAVNAEAWFVTVMLRQDATGGWEVGWPASVSWQSGTPPVLATDPYAVDVFTLLTVDGGTNWMGFPTGGGGTSSVAALDDLTDVTVTTPTQGDQLVYRNGTWVNEGESAATHWEIVVADGGTGDSGVLDSEYAEMVTQRTTTSASLADITGASVSLTLHRECHIAVWMTCHVSATAACDLGLAINIDGTDHDITDTHLTATDEGNMAIIHRTLTALAAGTYTVKGRFRRSAGGGTPAVDRADLFVAAMSVSGPVMITTDDGSDFIYAAV